MKINPDNYLAKPDKTITEHNNDLVDRANKLLKLGYINKKQHDFLVKISINHDLGKCNEEFQNRILAAKNGQKPKFDSNVEIPHNILSIFFMDEDDFSSFEEYTEAVYCVLNHHNYVDNYEYLTDRYELEKIDNLLSPFSIDSEGVDYDVIDEFDSIEKNDNITILEGLLRKCDYSASANNEIEIENNYLIQVLNAWKDSNHCDWRPLQKYALDSTDCDCITIAQTGMGKTEAALLWIGNNKGFFFLPLKVSINAIYDRCKDGLLHNKDFKEKVGLLHSGMLSYYNNDTNESDIFAHLDLTKNLALPLTISTLDQLFDFVFKYRGYELKVATLSYSKIVIDEIQSYDAKLMAALVYGLKQLHSYGTKIHILTATLPPYIRDFLITPDNNGNKIDFKFNKFLDDSVKRHNVNCIDNSMTAQDIYDGYQKHKGKTLVICNTVKQAQQIYNQLIKLGIFNIHLLHSKFTVEDRRNKESEILECGATSNKENVIWVTTQIVEASLDIDFDYLYTELCDLSSLFQRLGRVNRKGLKSVDDYNCFIYLKIQKTLLGKLVDNALYELSYDAMKNIDGLFLETKKDELIENYLTTENLKDHKSDYLVKYQKTYNELNEINVGDYDKNEGKLRDIKNITFVPLCVYSNHKTEIDNCLYIINDKASSVKDKIKAKDRIMDFTTAVPGYDKKKIGPDIIAPIIISNYEQIPIKEVVYTTSVGVEYPQKQQPKFI